jgi:hypothetical protein
MFWMKGVGSTWEEAFQAADNPGKNASKVAAGADAAQAGPAADRNPFVTNSALWSEHRWGGESYVRHNAGAVKDSFAVGIQQGVLFHVRGAGHSWEEAFSEADQSTESASPCAREAQGNCQRPGRRPGTNRRIAEDDRAPEA